MGKLHQDTNKHTHQLAYISRKQHQVNDIKDIYNALNTAFNSYINRYTGSY